MNDPAIWQLDTKRIGRKVLRYERVSSTNDLALALADDADHDGTVILAAEQTGGRGRHGRIWQCPHGMGVLFSCVLFPPSDLRRPVVLAAWAAVAVCETIRHVTKLNPQIKWPNDVLVHGRKVCGILIEQASATVVGIGLNVNQTLEMLNQSGLAGAGSLMMLGGRQHDVSDVAHTLIEQLDIHYHAMCVGELASLETQWKMYTGLMGRYVVVEAHDAVHTGKLLEFGWETVEIEVPSAGLIRLRPEHVSRITRSDMPEPSESHGAQK